MRPLSVPARLAPRPPDTLSILLEGRHVGPAPPHLRQPVLIGIIRSQKPAYFSFHVVLHPADLRLMVVDQQVARARIAIIRRANAAAVADGERSAAMDEWPVRVTIDHGPSIHSCVSFLERCRVGAIQRRSPQVAGTSMQQDQAVVTKLSRPAPQPG